MAENEKTPLEKFQTICERFAQIFEATVKVDSKRKKKTALTHPGSSAGMYLTYDVRSGLCRIEHYFVGENGGQLLLEKLRPFHVPNALSLYLSYNKHPLSVDELDEKFDVLSDRFDKYIVRATSMKKTAA